MDRRIAEMIADENRRLAIRRFLDPALARRMARPIPGAVRERLRTLSVEQLFELLMLVSDSTDSSTLEQMLSDRLGLRLA